MPRLTPDNDDYIYWLVGKNIKKQRKKLNMTQHELADKCCFNDTFISNIENDSYQTFSLNTLYHIAKVMGIDIKEFFNELDEENDDK